MKVPVLFVRPGSPYYRLGADVWDAERDARKWPGGQPAVFHPPCAAWSRLRAFSKATDDEKALAIWAVEHVRRFGGVLEHPAASLLWPVAGLPRPGCADGHGFTVSFPQQWFGHKARKASFFYVVGVPPRALPQVPFHLGDAVGTVERTLSHAQRAWTPEPLARWLMEVACLSTGGRAA